MGVHAHPSLAEIVGEAAMAVAGVAIHYEAPQLVRARDAPAAPV
jgi:hypothetical protein